MTNPTPPNRRKMPPLLTGVFLWLCFACGESKPPETMEKSSMPAENQLPSFRILILGDSLTEGYGVLESEAYPSLLEEKLNKELSPKTNLRYKIVNGGISGATTSGGVSRIEWFLQAKPDYLLVALGGNDGFCWNPSRRNEEEHRPNPQGGKAKRYPHHASGDENSAELRPRVFRRLCPSFRGSCPKKRSPLDSVPARRSRRQP